jgi:hypothetical protein
MVSGLSSLALLVGTLPSAAVAQPDQPLPVRVSIWEGLTDDWRGDKVEGTPSDVFEAPALGFVQLPAKVNERGIEVDRKAPFALRATATIQVPAGQHQLVLRAKGWSRLLIDGQAVAETPPISPNSSGHEPVPEPPLPPDGRWREVGSGDQEAIVAWESDGKPHEVEFLALLGARKLRPETGEMSVSVATPSDLPALVGASRPWTLTDDDWRAYEKAERSRIDQLDTTRRRQAAASQDEYSKARHELARREIFKALPPSKNTRPNDADLIDRRIGERLAKAGREPNPPVDDAAFLRRLSLDTIGVPPTAEEVVAFLADTRPDKRSRAIDDRLADSRWADGWMGYWQDVLAENPGILKPTLNNTGPFRRFLYLALLDDLPFDRLVTELIRMDGSPLYGGPAGFALATQNDAPMAAKAHVLAKAFLAADMKCARCHDAPMHPFDQGQLFALAGLLDGKPQVVPPTSTVLSQSGGRQPAVSVTLHAGDKVPPAFDLADLSPDEVPEGMLPSQATSRERLAALVVSPRNTRFAKVMVNRVWARYIGVGLVEPIDDWDGPDGMSVSHPELLDDLARDFVASSYDLKKVARRILSSGVYQARAEGPPPTGSSAEGRLFAGPVRRRLTAEQLVDSLFAVAGKDFGSERLCVDPEGRRPPNEMLDLGEPRRAWQFASTANERDRPALSLPVTQSFVDLMQTFGWRPARQDPITVREQAITPLQAALLANGVLTGRVARLSDDSAFTDLALRDGTVEDLVRALVLRVLSRPASDAETARLAAFLASDFEGRVVHGAPLNPKRRPVRRVSWSNHLHPRATELQLEEEKAARAGDPPTYRLTPEFRERMEDVVWALVNGPEFVFLP